MSRPLSDNKLADSIHDQFVTTLRDFRITRDPDERQHLFDRMSELQEQARELMPKLAGGYPLMALQVMLQRPVSELITLSNPQAKILS